MPGAWGLCLWAGSVASACGLCVWAGIVPSPFIPLPRGPSGPDEAPRRGPHYLGKSVSTVGIPCLRLMEALPFLGFVLKGLRSAIWDALGVPLGLLLGYSWAILGASWAPFGLLLGHLGVILGPSWAILVPSCTPLGHLGASAIVSCCLLLLFFLLCLLLVVCCCFCVLFVVACCCCCYCFWIRLAILSKQCNETVDQFRHVINSAMKMDSKKPT